MSEMEEDVILSESEGEEGAQEDVHGEEDKVTYTVWENACPLHLSKEAKATLYNVKSVSNPACYTWLWVPS